jgi:hypothetical protein
MIREDDGPRTGHAPQPEPIHHGSARGGRGGSLCTLTMDALAVGESRRWSGRCASRQTGTSVAGVAHQHGAGAEGKKTDVAIEPRGCARADGRQPYDPSRAPLRATAPAAQGVGWDGLVGLGALLLISSAGMALARWGGQRKTATELRAACWAR